VSDPAEVDVVIVGAGFSGPEMAIEMRSISRTTSRACRYRSGPDPAAALPVVDMRQSR
jgi:NADH dehydrogenase FAD-containing subunit